MVLSTAADLMRSKADLIAENALLRQQLTVFTAKSKNLPFPKLIGYGSSFSPVA